MAASFSYVRYWWVHGRILVTHASNQTVEYCSSESALHALIAYLQGTASLPVSAAGKRKGGEGTEQLEMSPLPFLLENEESIIGFLRAAAAAYPAHPAHHGHESYLNKYARAKPSALLTAVLSKKANEALQVASLLARFAFRKHTHTHTHARARTHTHTHARTHAHTLLGMYQRNDFQRC